MMPVTATTDSGKMRPMFALGFSSSAKKNVFITK
jgi:hypothetical protein